MRTFVLFVLSLVAIPTLAQEGMYAGVGYGSFDFDENDIDAVFGNRSDTVDTYKLFGGFEVNEHLSLEISYGATQDLRNTLTATDPIIGVFTTSVATEFTITTVKAIGQLPLDWGILMAGLGYYDLDADIQLRLDSSLGSFESGGTVGDDGMMAMLGIEWRFGRFGTGYGIRLEYEKWDLDGADASTIGIGASFRF